MGPGWGRTLLVVVGASVAVGAIVLGLGGLILHLLGVPLDSGSPTIVNGLPDFSEPKLTSEQRHQLTLVGVGMAVVSVPLEAIAYTFGLRWLTGYNVTLVRAVIAALIGLVAGYVVGLVGGDLLSMVVSILVTAYVLISSAKTARA